GRRLSEAAPLQSFCEIWQKLHSAYGSRLAMRMYEIYAYASHKSVCMMACDPCSVRGMHGWMHIRQPFLALPNPRQACYGCPASHGSCDPDSVCGLPGYF